MILSNSAPIKTNTLGPSEHSSKPFLFGDSIWSWLRTGVFLGANSNVGFTQCHKPSLVMLVLAGDEPLW